MSGSALMREVCHPFDQSKAGHYLAHQQKGLVPRSDRLVRAKAPKLDSQKMPPASNPRHDRCWLLQTSERGPERSAPSKDKRSNKYCTLHNTYKHTDFEFRYQQPCPSDSSGQFVNWNCRSGFSGTSRFAIFCGTCQSHPGKGALSDTPARAPVSLRMVMMIQYR